MVLFGQIGSIWASWLYLGDWFSCILAKGCFFLGKLVLFGQIGSIWANWFYLAKDGCIWANGDCIWANVAIWSNCFYLGKMVLFWEVGCI